MQRMLFSYNPAKSGEAWNHEQFQELIATALADYPVTISPMEHSHWMVEVSGDTLEAAQMGQQIATHFALQRAESNPSIEVLVLGGQKTAPSASSALGVGDWGVDVVETHDAQSFLDALNWNAMVQSKDSDTIFQAMAVSSIS